MARCRCGVRLLISQLPLTSSPPPPPPQPPHPPTPQPPNPPPPNPPTPQPPNPPTPQPPTPNPPPPPPPRQRQRTLGTSASWSSSARSLSSDGMTPARLCSMSLRPHRTFTSSSPERLGSTRPTRRAKRYSSPFSGSTVSLARSHSCSAHSALPRPGLRRRTRLR